jgi:hypothetical protein
MAISRWKKLLASVSAFAPFPLSERVNIRTVIRRNDRVLVRDAREGQTVMVVGRIRMFTTPLQAPLSRQPCVYYDMEVEEEREEDGILRVPVTAAERRQDFLVADETGEALVRMDYAWVSFPRPWNYKFDPAVDDLLTASGRKWGGGGPLRGPQSGRIRIRYREAFLSEGMPVCVLGRARWEVAADGPTAIGYRGPRLLLTLDPDPPDRLIISGALKDWIDYFVT